MAQRRGATDTPSEAPVQRPKAEAPVRLNRWLAMAGVASRRDADALIAEGRVHVDGAVVTELGFKVTTGQAVTVDGRTVSPRGLVYILLNKPKDTITTTDDERGRRTVLDLIDIPDSEKEGLYPVGRLDRDTLGALLLTNDGDLAFRLMHPRHKATKIYVVRTDDPVRPHQMEHLAKGVPLEDGLARVDHITYTSDDPREVALELHEGRNRQVRRMFEAIGHTIDKLERVQYAGLSLTGLRRGRWRRLEPHEINTLRQRVKLKPFVFETDSQRSEKPRGRRPSRPR